MIAFTAYGIYLTTHLLSNKAEFFTARIVVTNVMHATRGQVANYQEYAAVEKYSSRFPEQIVDNRLLIIVVRKDWLSWGQVSADIG